MGPFNVSATLSKVAVDQLASNIAFQRQTINQWSSLHPNLVEASWDFLDRIRLRVIGLNEKKKKLYSETYQIATAFYDLSRVSLNVAATSLKNGNNIDAQANYKKSLLQLIYADNFYSAAHSVWYDHLSAAQNTLYGICGASAKVAGASFGGIATVISGGAVQIGTIAISGNLAIGAPMEAGIKIICNDAFGKSDQNLKDAVGTLGGAVIGETLGMVSKTFAGTVKVIKELSSMLVTTVIAPDIPKPIPIVLTVPGWSLWASLFPGDIFPNNPEYLAVSLKDFLREKGLSNKAEIISFNAWPDRNIDATGDAVTALKEQILRLNKDAKNRGVTFHIVAHSWGTVLTYTALTDLVKDGNDIRVENFFTFGSPIGYITGSKNPISIDKLPKDKKDCVKYGIEKNPIQFVICKHVPDSIRDQNIINPQKVIKYWYNYRSNADTIAMPELPFPANSPYKNSIGITKEGGALSKSMLNNLYNLFEQTITFGGSDNTTKTVSVAHNQYYDWRNEESKQTATHILYDVVEKILNEKVSLLTQIYFLSGEEDIQLFSSSFSAPVVMPSVVVSTFSPQLQSSPASTPIPTSAPLPTPHPSSTPFPVAPVVPSSSSSPAPSTPTPIIPIPTPLSRSVFLSNTNSITVMKGDIVSQSISVTMPTWNTDTLRFTVKDMPLYVSHDFTPPSCKTSCTTTLKINVGSPDTPAGSYQVTVGTLDGPNITSSFELKIVERTSPSAPIMQATPISASQIKLSWSDNAAQDDYLYIERKTKSGNDYAFIHGEQKRSLTWYVDSGLTPNTRYCYQLYFKNAYVPSPNYSQEQCATTLQDASPIPQGKPDLMITSLRAPTEAYTGGKDAMLNNVSITIANNGTVSAGRFRVEFYWSRDNIITVDDVPAVSYFIPNGLGPGESKTSKEFGYDTVSIPASLSPDTYYLGAIIDDKKETTENGSYKAIFVEGGQVQESDETNNARVADTGQIILNGPPQPPRLISPDNEATFTYSIDGYITHRWSSATESNYIQFFEGSSCSGVQASGNSVHNQEYRQRIQPSKIYSWWVKAMANGVYSAPSECRSFTVVAEAIPTTPDNVMARLGSDSPWHDQKRVVTITWDDTSSNELGFSLARKGGVTDYWSDIISSLNKNTTSVYDNNVSNGAMYCYKVKARGTSGPSDYSKETCVTIPL